MRKTVLTGGVVLGYHPPGRKPARWRSSPLRAFYVWLGSPGWHPLDVLLVLAAAAILWYLLSK